MTQAHEARFWADGEADLLAPSRPHVIRDSKTPSGEIPISSLRGPIITDALYRTFKARGLEVRYVFTIDDYDPMDSQSMRQRAGMVQHMGKPFANIPSPDPAYTDFARQHATKFLETFAYLGIRPQEIHWLRDLYRSGDLDAQIDLVLHHASVIREIYARVANVIKDERWLPIGVICENCGRLGTTYAFDYDGKTVAYECRRDLVDWAEGCGHTGRRSPFRGGAKLYWNLQWCAMWDHFGVTYEEGGKDLLTAGGSRDRANEVYRQVWRKEPPIGLIHEFINVGGRKMSTSRPEDWKGLGVAAHELVQIYPPELIRFLMLRTHPKRHIDFDPTGDNLPKLIDEYDRCEDSFVVEPGSDFAKIWALSQVEEKPAPLEFRVRFSIVAEWVQTPGVEVFQLAEQRKGSGLTDREQIDLLRRRQLAETWLERWAPDHIRHSFTPQVPQVSLTEQQREFLGELADFVHLTRDFAVMQELLRTVAKRKGLADARGNVTYPAYQAVYLTFLGKPIGPKAARVLTALPIEATRTRIQQVLAQ